jgi:hypothetical protein
MITVRITHYCDCGKTWVRKLQLPENSALSKDPYMIDCCASCAKKRKAVIHARETPDSSYAQGRPMIFKRAGPVLDGGRIIRKPITDDLPSLHDGVRALEDLR